MKRCTACGGFAPLGVTRCPNCAVGPGRMAIAALAGFALFGESCGVLSAAYGIPCTSKQVDGGLFGCPGECETLQPDGGDPRKDPANLCFRDGGVP
jgi:hypothetical protein